MKFDLNHLQARERQSPLYQISGVSCQGCVTKIENHLNQLTQVRETQVDLKAKKLQLTLHEDLSLESINTSLSKLDPKYQASITPQISTSDHHKQQTWLATYKPILLIFSFLVLVTSCIQYQSGSFDLSVWMRHFMAGFFLIFSFFKFLNLRGFAQSYSMYDIIAMRWSTWGYLYAFIELGLGIAYLTNFSPILTNSVALVIMSISIIGVLRSVLNKQSIQCACLGDVFNLPMSTVTIIEDGLMIVMSAWMLVQHL